MSEEADPKKGWGITLKYPDGRTYRDWAYNIWMFSIDMITGGAELQEIEEDAFIELYFCICNAEEFVEDVFGGDWKAAFIHTFVGVSLFDKERYNDVLRRREGKTNLGYANLIWYNKEVYAKIKERVTEWWKGKVVEVVKGVWH